MTDENALLLDGELVKHLAIAPASQLDPSMVELLKGWSDPPKAIEILEVLDRSIYSSLASGTVIAVLQVLYKIALRHENTTHADMLSKVTWR